MKKIQLINKDIKIDKLISESKKIDYQDLYYADDFYFKNIGLNIFVKNESMYCLLALLCNTVLLLNNFSLAIFIVLIGITILYAFSLFFDRLKVKNKVLCNTNVGIRNDGSIYFKNKEGKKINANDVNKLLKKEIERLEYTDIMFISIVLLIFNLFLKV